MNTLDKYKFADWLYNRFVEQFKKSNITEAFIYLGVLSQYQFFAQEVPKLSDQRRHIKELYKKITKALKDKNADQLSLTGEEAIEAFNMEIQAYEARMRAIGLSEEYIKLKVDDKKLNYRYGN